MKPGESYFGVSVAPFPNILRGTILASATFVVDSSRLTPAA